ncbi:uracil-xanthine permease family protein [Egicoccus sp. AB-alg6-2]|uniref:uracil-xanthine permease family protein n=1 Tax=Egicoccus sp. AB-alg6-2 TaxID=3242692 RepID=UPI00359D874D
MSAEAPNRPHGLKYGLDEIPKPLPKAMALGLQHVLTMFGATVAVPFILSPFLEFDSGQLAILISSVFICSAIATFLQVQFGSRLPIVQGVSFAFLGPFIGIALTYQGEDAMRYIAGAIMAGAVVEMAIGFGGIGGLLRRYVTPITIAPVIALIGLSLYDATVINASPNWWLALATTALIVLFGLVLAPRSRMISLFPILLAVVTAYLVCLLLSVTGVLPETVAGYVSFGVVGETPWVRGFDVGGGGLIFPWGTPLFDLGFFFAILAAYLASTIESFGDYHAISRIAGAGDPDAKTINRGIGMEGVGCFFTGIFGGFSSTSYSENIGLVGLTKVASRAVVLIGAVFLLLFGFVAKIGAFIATIPGPIVGGVYLALFGLIAAIGLSNLRRVDLDSQRNLMILGIVLFSGFVFPQYFGNYAGDEWSLFGIGWLTSIVRAIGSSGIAVAAVLGLLLDNLVPGTDEERGVGTYDLGTKDPVIPPGDMQGV